MILGRIPKGKGALYAQSVKTPFYIRSTRKTKGLWQERGLCLRNRCASKLGLMGQHKINKSRKPQLPVTCRDKKGSNITREQGRGHPA